ncbi:FAD-dependent oxidoreductase [Spirochaetota bacterium]
MDANKHIHDAIIDLLQSGCDGVIGLRKQWGHTGPYVFTSENELNGLIYEERYPMANIARALLEKSTGIKYGIVARGCDVRAIQSLVEDSVLDKESIEFIGIACSKEQAKICNCEKPIYTVTKCTGCWKCVENCPEEAIEISSCCPIVLPNEFDKGLTSRRAIYSPYVQAVPRVYLRDEEHCLKLNDKIDCKGCTNICKAEAIMTDDHMKEKEIEVGSVLVVPGFDEFLTQLQYDYGYSLYKDVVTSMEFERILSASGPFSGHVQRLSDRTVPKKIAFLQCVGSRDINCRNRYCSSVCCMYAIKEAVIAKEHMGKVDVTIFFMDIRAFGKDFDKYFERAKSEYGVKFVRARVSDVFKADGSKQFTLKYSGETGSVIEDRFDMVVLSVGLEPSEASGKLAEKLEIRREPNKFIWTEFFNPLTTSRSGIFVGGAASGPKDIPETVTQASGAASKAMQLLSDVRDTLTVTREFPAERDITRLEPRIGVFICHCGINIGGVIDIEELTEFTKQLPYIVHVENNLYTCSQDTQEHIRDIIVEQDLNRVLVASCTPRTHEPLFRETVKEASLNPYLFEMANIRDQCSWIHMHQPLEATSKAKDLVRSAAAKASLLKPLYSVSIPVNNSALVIGGGISGMTAAYSLAEQGFPVHLVEQEEELGGNMKHIYYLPGGKDPQRELSEMIQKISDHANITVWHSTTLESMKGFIGNFETVIKKGDKETTLKHGAVVVATGAVEYTPTEYLYGKDKNVITQHDLEEQLKDGKIKAKRVVMIQCVGSREEGHMYCSRVCCNNAIKNSLKIKKISPKTEVYILYRDIRSYGFNEDYFQAARDSGVVFLRYDADKKPDVSNKKGLQVRFADKLMAGEVTLDADLVVLSTRIDPEPGNEKLAQMLKVPTNEDGFYLEAHMKLRPVDFSVEGVFLAGMAHGPKNISESIAQAEAAASRAATFLSKKEYIPEANVSVVDDELCSGCKFCTYVCPYEAISFDEERQVSVINKALCKGCGSCAATCSSQAISSFGFTDRQLLAQLDAVLQSF